jgi:hypothetical protein
MSAFREENLLSNCGVLDFAGSGMMPYIPHYSAAEHL